MNQFFKKALVKKAMELAQDPANQERLKKIARDRFGMGSPKGATDQPSGGRVDSGQSSDESHTSGSFGTEGLNDASSTDAATSYDPSESGQRDDPTMDSTHEAEKGY
jgi:hypothetical protein